MSKFKSGVLSMFAALLGLLLSTLPSFAGSQVRIVRLSAVQGHVQIDRATGQGFEKAFINLPITQGAQIRTGEDGFAEVEFEDASTLRIAPGTAVAFPQLALDDAGSKLSTVEVDHGIAYANFAGTKKNQLTLTFAREHIAFAKPSHLRLEVVRDKAMVAVLAGEVQVAGASGVVELEKKHSVVFDLMNQDQYKVAKNVEEGTYDAWDKQEDQIHQRDLQKTAVNNSPYSYGLADLNYYGSFMNLPGYGMMWQPYFTGAGWDPFMDGAWAWYPGMGYGWVSSYPWGWTPYHYGSWMFVSSYGWMWQPGGVWNGLGNMPLTAGAPQGFAPPRPPATAVHTLVTVNRGPVMASPGMAASNKLVIRSGSAGIGIPRGSVQNLAKFSQQVQQHGSATATVHTAPAPAMYGGARPMGGPAGYSRATAAQSRGASPSQQGAAARQNSAPAYHPSASAGSSSAGGGGMHSAASAPASSGARR